MTNVNSKIVISAPGRVCLFGEHQDYLGLPVIASAISKRIYIEGQQRNDSTVNIELPDIGGFETFKIGEKLKYTKERDYFKSALNVLIKNDFSFSSGFDCTIHGNIPINSGTSSSSALVVAFINFLARISDQKIILNAEKNAELAHKAEVLEFNEPGGMMDHYSSALGGIIHLSSFPKVRLKNFFSHLGPMILGNSNEPKETKSILARVKNGVLNICNTLIKKFPDFNLQNVTIEQLEKFHNDITIDEYQLLFGTVRNRDITKIAENVLEKSPFDHRYFGDLINQHHHILRDVLKISTKKIDTMIDAALEAGAFGAKINGSGGGGCMFAYAPENTELVLEAVSKISPESFIVYSDAGVKEEINKESI